jgi:hypothetical protein
MSSFSATIPVVFKMVSFKVALYPFRGNKRISFPNHEPIKTVYLLSLVDPESATYKKRLVEPYPYSYDASTRVE